MASFVRPDISVESRTPARLTRWEREDIAKERRLRASKCELSRENTADKLRCPLCFCLPCVIIAFILLVLIGVYIVRPFVKGGGLVKTQCVVRRQEFGEEGACSYNTEEFAPCIKIMVTFNTSDVQEIEAILMENEKTLVHCDKCSITYGSSDLFARHLSCPWNSELTADVCWTQYLAQFGQANTSYPCYYDPEKTDDVARTLKVGQAQVASLLFFLLLFILLWIGGLAFVLYDRFKRRSADSSILRERRERPQLSPQAAGFSNGGIPRHLKRPEYEADTSTMTSVTSMALSVDSMTSTPRTRRRRKKKMPCCRPHYQFNYLDEGIVLEEKSISALHRQSSSRFSYLALDTTPTCTCFHTGQDNMGFDILPQRNNFRPVMAAHSASRTPGRILRYLPESIV